MATALIFPGQGSQAAGMGRGLWEASPTAREVFQEVDDALGEKLSRLMFEGPEDTLTMTANAQPAIMAVSVAAARVLEREGGVRVAQAAAFVAGHSLGEYSALCAAGALPLADAARLLRRRGEAMQAAVAPDVGAMAAVIGLEYDVVAACCVEAAQNEICEAANDNAPGQVVVSGHAGAVERACDLARSRGARHALPLLVSAPFHCALMRPAADAMAAALEDSPLRGPYVPVVTNVTARPESDPAAIRAGLVEQITARVRWRESVEWMVADGGIDRLVELGGRVLSPMVKRITKDARGDSVVTMAEIEALAKSL